MRLYCCQEMCVTGITLKLDFKVSSRMNRTKPAIYTYSLTLKSSFRINWLKPVRNSKDAWQFCAAFNRCAFLLPACAKF